MAQSRDPWINATLDAWHPASAAVALSANPGRLAFEDESGRQRRWPLPTGLWTLIFDRPELDPEDEGFDWVEAVDFTLGLSSVLSLGGDDSPGLGFGAQPLARFNPADLDGFLPRDGGDLGTTRVRIGLDRVWRLGPRWGSLRVLFLQYERRAYLDPIPDARLRAWIDGQVPRAGETATLSVDTFTGANLSSGIGWAREFRLHTPAPDPQADWRDAYWDREANALRLGLGATLRRSTGLIFQRYQGRFDFVEEAGQLRVRPQMQRELSEVDFFDNLPGTWALDLGTVLRWRRFQLGAGVSDLLARWKWNQTSVDFFQTGPGNDVTRIRQSSDTQRDEPGPRSRWRLDAYYTPASARVFAAAEGGLGGTNLQFGAAQSLGDAADLRAALQRDRRKRWQAGAGVLWQPGRYGLELGLRTHSYNLSGRREVAISLALVRL